MTPNGDSRKHIHAILNHRDPERLWFLTHYITGTCGASLGTHFQRNFWNSWFWEVSVAKWNSRQNWSSKPSKNSVNLPAQKKFKIQNKNFHLGSIYWDSVGNWESCSWDSGWEWEQIESQQIFWLKNGQTLCKHSKISTIFSFLLVFKIFNLKRLYFHRYY